MSRVEDAGRTLQMSQVVFVFRDDALRHDGTIKQNAMMESLDGPDCSVDRLSHSLEDSSAGSS